MFISIWLVSVIDNLALCSGILDHKVTIRIALDFKGY